MFQPEQNPIDRPQVGHVPIKRLSEGNAIAVRILDYDRPYLIA
jgi:hypothetical protein